MIGIVAVGAIAGGLVPGVHLFSTPPSGSGSSPPPSPTSSSAAVATAAPLARSLGDGQLEAIVGISSTTAFQYGSAQSITYPACAPQYGLSENLTFAAQTGAYSTGALGGWLLVYYSASTQWGSWIAVLGSQAISLGYFPTLACSQPLPELVPLSGTYLNSTAAAQDAASVAAGFVAAHAEASVEYALDPSNVTSSAPVWHLLYTTCGVGPNMGVGTGDSFNVYLNAVDGHVLSFTNVTGGACSQSLGPAPPPLGRLGLIALSVLGSSSSASGSDVSLGVSTTPGLNTSFFGFLLSTAAANATVATAAVPTSCAIGADGTVGAGLNCPFPASGWYAVVTNASNSVVTTYGGTNAHWTVALLLSASDTLWIVSHSALSSEILTPYTYGTENVVGSIAL